MTYEQALEYLASLGKFGINLGLARIEKLLDLMGRPERRFKTVHVTGTNGKGSTTAMLASILRAAGIRTGMYTSPHLEDYTERFMIDGEPIGRAALAAAIEHTRVFVDAMTAEGWEHPTEFEVLTAAAFHHFAAAGVEYAVVEVGLGGLLDSTNVILPEVAVITNVTLEHTDRCGGTVAEIAAHKAGIIKPVVPVVTAARGAALDVIRRTAEAKGAPLTVLERDFYVEAAGSDGWRQQVAVVSRRHGDLGRFLLSLLGRHQAENAAVAVMAALAVGDKEKRVTLAAIRAGLGDTSWPGRFEVVPGRPTLVIDGAHNPAGAAVLRATLDEVFPDRPVVFVLGILGDKDIAGITDVLVRAGDGVVAVKPLSERAADQSRVLAAVRAERAEAAATVAEGVDRARDLAGPDGLVCVAGSLYLVGPARRYAVK
ncbi:MAG TPA: folylpolyglutamate synthase/dihydrofolate synthase family protein [Negativicutes bacterium]|nr:folylpolyglutamate synthase/dihydrofolate synthase family protein [Negativicutes bacterium]